MNMGPMNRFRQSSVMGSLSLRWKMLIGFGLLMFTALTLVVAAVTFGIPFTGYSGSYGRERAKILDHLSLFADSKKDRLANWLRDRKEDVTTITANLVVEAPSIRRLHELVHMNPEKGESDDRLRATILNDKDSSVFSRHFHSLAGINKAFEKVQIVDAPTGLIVASTDTDEIGNRVPHKSVAAGTASREGEIRLSIEKVPPAQKTYLVIWQSLDDRLWPTGSRDQLGSMLFLYIDAEVFVRPLLSTGGLLGESGDIMLVDQDARILLPRYHPLPNGIVPETVEYRTGDRPSVLASRGHEGIVVADDYRGVPVLAASRHIKVNPDAGWGIVAKCDRSESLIPLKDTVFCSGLIGIVALTGAGLLAILIAGKISSPIEDLTRTAQQVKEGNLRVRAAVTGGSDELGILTTAFNSMIERFENWHGELEWQVKVRTSRLNRLNSALTNEIELRTRAEESLKNMNRRLRTLSHCDQAVVRATAETELLNQICRLIGEVGGSPAVWVKIAPRNESATDRTVACWGVEDRDVAQLTESLALHEKGTGPTGIAIRTGEVLIVKDAASDPITASGHEAMKRKGIVSLVSFPLKIGKDVVGALTIAAGEPNSIEDEELLILEELACDLAYGIEMLRTRASRWEAETALRESEQRFRAVFENDHVVMLVIDPETGVIVDCSPGAGFFSGYDREELINKKMADLSVLAPEEVLARIRMAMTLEQRCFDVRHRLACGEFRDVETCTGPIVVGDKTLLLSTVTDVTGRKRAEEATARANEEWHETFDAIADLVMVLDDHYRVLRANRAMLDALGRQSEDVVGKFCFHLVHGADQPPLYCPYSLMIQNGEEHAAEITEPLLGGTYEVRVSPLVSKDGRSDRYIHIVRDITARKKAEEDLERSRRSFNDIVEKNHDGVLVLDGNYSVLYANGAASRFFGRDRDALIGTHFGQAVLLEERTEIHIVRPEAEPIVAEMTVGSVDWQGEPAQLVMLHDITDRTIVEKTLKASEERMRLLIEASPIGIRIVREGRTVYVNPAFLGMFGYGNQEEVIGLSGEAFCSSEDAESMMQYEDRCLNGLQPTGYGEFKARKKTGESFDIAKWLTSIEFQGEPAVLVFVADISREKTLKSQLLQAQKMEAIGTLAGGIAHDFNNLLTVISGFSELLLAEKGENTEAYEDIEKIFRASRNGATLVKHLLTFSRKVETKRRPVKLNLQVQNIEKLLTRTIPKTIQLELHLEDELKIVHADPSQIEQLLVNLALNSKQAMPEGGRLIFETGNITLTEDYARAHLGCEPGEYVVLTVSDTGHGMEKHVLERVFEPFFTTKKAGEGTGLGLAMVYGIVKGHGGHIECNSEPDVGTVFKIYLPVLHDEAEAVVQETRELPVGGTETILLVDDEETVRDLGAKLLSQVGYTVLSAKNGREGLDVYRKNSETIDLIILDLIMPEMDGKRCLRELLKINPQVKVIISSGYSSHGSISGVMQDGAREFVEKPYKVASLLGTIRRTLDQN